MRRRRAATLGAAGVLTATAAIAAGLNHTAARSAPAPAMPRCPAHLPTAAAVASTRPGVDRVLAPSGAIAVLLCEFYVHRASETAPWTDRFQSRTVVTGTALTDLNTTFDVSVRTLPCTGDPGDLGYPEAEFVFRYSSGPDVTVLAAYSTFCAPDVPTGVIAGNGTISGVFDFGAGGNQLYGFRGQRA